MATARPASAILALPSEVSSTLGLCKQWDVSSSLSRGLQAALPELHLDVKVQNILMVKVAEPLGDVQSYLMSPA